MHLDSPVTLSRWIEVYNVSELCVSLSACNTHRTSTRDGGAAQEDLKDTLTGGLPAFPPSITRESPRAVRLCFILRLQTV
jgi:hypothetical protein